MAREMTTKAQEAVSSALQAAGAAGNPQVEPIHLLEALIEQREGIALSLLEAVGADVRAIGARTRNALVALPSAQGASAGSAQPSNALLAVVRDAGERAEAGGDQYISTEHLLIALAASQTEAGRILSQGGVEADALTQRSRSCAPIRSPRRIPRVPLRPCPSTAVTSRRSRAKESLTRLSAATTRFAASCRSCLAVPRTTRF